MIVKISNNGSEHEDKAKAHLEIVPTDASLVEKRFDSASALVKGSLFRFPRRSISAPEFRTLSADALRAAGDAGAKERGVAANPEVPALSDALSLASAKSPDDASRMDETGDLTSQMSFQ
jgi:hypothetical protein